MPKFQTNDGVWLHYELDGDPQHPLVVLLGGYTSNVDTWVAQVGPLQAAGFRVLRFDYRNHGQSEQTNQGLRIARLAMDLANLLAALSIDKFSLMGHSMGAMVASQYLSLFGDTKVTSIITEDQTPRMLNTPDWQFGIANSSYAMMDEIAMRFPTMKLTRQPLPLELKRQVSAHYVPFDFKYNQPLLIDGMVQDWRDVIQAETIPHLFLAGTASPLYPVAHAEQALALQIVPGSAMHVFDGVGHIPHLEVVTEFNEVVVAFLRRWSE